METFFYTLLVIVLICIVIVYEGERYAWNLKKRTDNELLSELIRRKLYLFSNIPLNRFVEENSRLLGRTYARQYKHNNAEPNSTDFVFSNNEITDGCIEMAKLQQNFDIERTVSWVLNNTTTNKTELEIFEGITKSIKE